MRDTRHRTLWGYSEACRGRTSMIPSLSGNIRAEYRMIEENSTLGEYD